MAGTSGSPGRSDHRSASVSLGEGPALPVVATAGAALALLIAVVAVTGWILDIEVAKRVGADLATMKLNTAVALGLLAAAVLARDRVGGARVATGAVVAIAGATLAEYVAGWDLGIDELLVQDRGGGTAHPGRMAETTVLCLLATALALRSVARGRFRLAGGLALGTAAISWVGLLGYLFGVRDLYEVGRFSPMAVHTAVALLAISVAVLATIPGGALEWIVRGADPGAAVLRRVLPLAFVVLPVVASVRLAAQRAGWFDTEVGLALMVLAAGVGIVLVAVMAAREINHSDAARLAALDQLRTANATLETRVQERTSDLASAEAWSRALAGSAPVGIFRTDHDGRCVYVNDRWCEIYGQSRQEALGDGWTRTIHSEDHDWVFDAWNQAVDRSLDFDEEFRVHRPDGRAVWVHARATEVTHGSAGLGHVGTVEDITERREIESARREAEALFRTTFESSPIGMALVTAAGAIVVANVALAEVTGYDVSTLAAMRLESMLHPDDAGEQPAGGTDRRIVRSDGTVLWATVRRAEITRSHGSGDRLEIVQVLDTTERRHFEERLVHLANHDPLTGLTNRRGFESALSAQVEWCKRYGARGAVLLFDLDHFKNINDTYGHSIGDQVIVSTAHALSRRLRGSDVAARLGGDEFAVLLPEGSRHDAETLAQAIVETIREAGATIAGRRVPLTASVGVAAFDETQRSADEMIVNADLAMYDAKDQGRDGWAAYASDKYDEPRSKARITWIHRIETALDEDRFQLHAQPIVDLTTGETVQLEVLLRLVGEDGELIPPATFLYIAERYGLAPRIDRWVLNEVFEVLESTERDPFSVSLAVNISGPSLNDPAVINALEQRIRARTFTPERLVLEVTETAAIANVAAARAFAVALRSLGYRFALDDFGAGFASFYYLKHLPFDFIKIDGEFVANCLDDPVDQAIIGSLVDLARSLGKETIAEHVPNGRARRFLRQRGVDHGQGHHLGRPILLRTALLNAMTGERGLEQNRRADLPHERGGRATPSQDD